MTPAEREAATLGVVGEELITDATQAAWSSDELRAIATALEILNGGGE